MDTINSKRENILVDRSFNFSLSIIRLYTFLKEERKEYVLSKQLLRSGTAIGALIRESQNAESKPDFIHKPGIAQKECDETMYWLELSGKTETISSEQFDTVYSMAAELLRILRSIIISTKNNLKK